MDLRARLPAAALLALALASGADAAPADWCSNTQAPPQGPSHEQAVGLALNPPETRVFATGRSTTAGPHSQAVTLAYNATSGARLWQANLSSAQGNARGWDVVAPNGTQVYVYGWEHADVVVVAYDAVNGSQAWKRNHPMVPNVQRAMMATDAAPNLVFAALPAQEPVVAAYADIATYAYHTNGTLAWNRTYAPGGTAQADNPQALALAPSGQTVFVAGMSQDATSVDMVVLAYNATNGADRWSHRLDLTALQETWEAAAASPDGARLYLAGWFANATGPATSRKEMVVAAYDASGDGAREPLWHLRHNVSGENISVSGLAYDPGTGLLVATGSVTSGQGAEYLTAAFDTAAPALAWTARHGDAATGHHRAVAVGVGQGPAFVVTGCSPNPDNHDIATLAYSAQGNVTWSRTTNATGNPGDDTTWHNGLLLNGNGSLAWVAGGTYSGNTTGMDVLLLAHDVANNGTPAFTKVDDLGSGGSPPPPPSPGPPAAVPVVALAGSVALARAARRRG